MDRDLVEQARRGDREAFAVLVHQVSDSLYAVAQRILRDPGLAEDALQNALVLAWRRLPHLREPDRFEAWIHRILVHACYDESQRARQWTANVRVLPIDGPTTPDGTAAVADRDELERAFRRLPIDQRAVFVLHHYLGLPLVEIAEMLEIPAGTARSRLHYATRGLRDALTAERSRCPRRTSRMTDDRSLERAARSWLETGPTEAPDRAVEAALLRIETTPQERDLRIPWRLPRMTTPARVAAAAVIGVLAIGGASSARQTRSARRRRARPITDLVSVAPSTATAVPSTDRRSSNQPSLPMARSPRGPMCRHRSRQGRLTRLHDAAATRLQRSPRPMPSTSLPSDGWGGDRLPRLARCRRRIRAGRGDLGFNRGNCCKRSLSDCDQPRRRRRVPVGPSVDDFANALADHPLLDATDPSRVRSGGYSGKYVDLSAAVRTSPAALRSYFPWEPGIYGEGPGHGWQLWILDVDGVRVVVRPWTTQDVAARHRAGSGDGGFDPIEP